MKYLHINEFFFPHIAGPTNHMYDVIQNTFSLSDHAVVTFDYNDQLKIDDSYDGIPVKRFHPLVDRELFRYLHLGAENSPNLSNFVQYLRKNKPVCIVLYFIGYIPYILCNALPEMRFILLPFGYNDGDFQFIYRNKRVKIALCGDGCLNDYIKAGAAPEQIHVIERPINTDYYKPMNVVRDPYRLLFVGRFHTMKRVPALVKMLTPLFGDYPNLHLHIVAETNLYRYTGGMKEELEKVQAVIKDNGLSGRVIFRGKLCGEDLLREYSEAAIHVLPSNLDRRATVVQEAITMGMQCVNTCKRAYDWPEYAEDGRHLIHYAGEDVESMAPVIRNLLESGPHPSNRDYALKHWSWEKWKPEYEKLMTEW